MKKHSLSIAVFFNTFFYPCIFSANLLVDYNDQKEGSCFTQPSSQVQQPKQVCDYTILNHKNINHTPDNIEEIDEDLGDNLLAINAKLVTTNNQPSPLLLGAVLQHQQKQEYRQYLIANTGLLSEATQSNAVKKAHKKRFHLIKATPQHVILQLFAWLQVSQHYTVIALHTNKPVCQHCHFIANNLWKQKLQTNEKGCFSTPFPLLGKMPSLAQQYINTHFHLSFVQSLLIPMMGYVSKEEMNKAIQQKEQEIASFIASMEATKDEQITMLSNEVKNTKKQLDEKNEHIQMLNKEINKKDKQLNDKSQELNNLKAQLRKCREKNTDYQHITEKLNTLRNKFTIQINNIDIQNENSVRSFVLKVQEERKQFNEDMQTLRNWYAKYKGNDWKYFYTKNSDGIYWREIYDDIIKKMEKIYQNDEKGTIFSSILQSLKTVLSTKKARLWGVKEALDQNSLKNKNYRLEIGRINHKLQRASRPPKEWPGWRWVE